ncbi:MAG: flagellar basal body-associated FliL family protein [Desulfamplus sp.]|nr:flagellar basal body-associated FliL family protein [Desulfamplus sp.]
MSKKKSANHLCVVKQFLVINICLIIFLMLCLTQITGCKDEETKTEPKAASPQEIITGTWSRYENKVYTLLIIRGNGNWSSDFRIEGGTSKIIERKGKASGLWAIEDKYINLTVTESDMENVWTAGTTYKLEIIELNKKNITVKYPNGRLITWKKARVQKEAKKEGVITPVIPMKPLIVNLNKISSNDKDRYLCIALELNLDEMSPSDIVPKLHPRAWDAAILFLSSLLYNDVRTFDEMKVITERLTTILNPYLDGLLVESVSKQVVITSSMDKVEEFIIEHSPPPVLETPEGEKPKEEKPKEEKPKEEKPKEEKKKEK